MQLAFSFVNAMNRHRDNCFAALCGMLLLTSACVTETDASASDPAERVELTLEQPASYETTSRATTEKVTSERSQLDEQVEPEDHAPADDEQNPDPDPWHGEKDE